MNSTLEKPKVLGSCNKESVDFKFTGNFDEDEDDGINPFVHPEVVGMIYYNPIIMEKIISYIPSVKDRVNIETCSLRMQKFSSRAEYLDANCDNALLDMHFENVKPDMTIAVSENKVLIPITTSGNRHRDRDGDGRHVQPPESLERLRTFLLRFVKQIKSLRIGSIHDIHRKFWFIDDHELYLSMDIVEVLGCLRNLRSLCIRNCLLSAPVLDQWVSDESMLMQKLQSICFHSIWFSQSGDCSRLANIIKYNMRSVHMSNCGTQVMCQVADRIMHLGVKLDYAYILFNVHSIGRELHNRRALERLSLAADEIQLCVCLSTLAAGKEGVLLNKFLRYLTEYPKITVLELDIGVPSPRRFPNYVIFFSNIRDLYNLRTLRISSIPLNDYSEHIFELIVQGVASLDFISEFSIQRVGENITSEILYNLCYALPKKLKGLSIRTARNLTGDHVRLIVDRCADLEVLSLMEAEQIGVSAAYYALSKLPKLKAVFFTLTEPVTAELVELMCNKEATPSLEAVSFGCTAVDPFTEEMCARLALRFQFNNDYSHAFDDYNATVRQYYKSAKSLELLCNPADFGICPGCEKDLTMFQEDDA